MTTRRLHRRTSATRPTPLTNRERQILQLLAGGASGREVARDLRISHETVRTHVRNAMRKLGARTRVHAVSLALEQGEITLDRSLD